MNLGKILLLLSVISTAVLIYLNAPPRGTLVFFIILLSLATPFLYYFWNFRGQMLLMEGQSKILAMLATLIMCVFAVFWYEYEYNRHVFLSDTDPQQALYFPLQENKALASLLEKGGGTLNKTVEQFGFDLVEKEIAGNTTKSDYLVTDAYFILVAILGYLSLFLLLLFLYLEVWVKNIFGIANPKLQFKKEIWKLLREGQLNAALAKLGSAQIGWWSSKTNETISSIAEQYNLLEPKKMSNELTSKDYSLQKNRLTGALLNVIS